jgi:hypothetical protein
MRSVLDTIAEGLNKSENEPFEAKNRALIPQKNNQSRSKSAEISTNKAIKASAEAKTKNPPKNQHKVVYTGLLSLLVLWFIVRAFGIDGKILKTNLANLFCEKSRDTLTASLYTDRDPPKPQWFIKYLIKAEDIQVQASEPATGQPTRVKLQPLKSIKILYKNGA